MCGCGVNQFCCCRRRTRKGPSTLIIIVFVSPHDACDNRVRIFSRKAQTTNYIWKMIRSVKRNLNVSDTMETTMDVSLSLADRLSGSSATHSVTHCEYHRSELKQSHIYGYSDDCDYVHLAIYSTNASTAASIPFLRETPNENININFVLSRPGGV